MRDLDIGYLILSFVVFIFSLSFHESAHALVSSKFGDETGRALGRISMNPARHIDPIGTLLFPLINVLTGVPLIGWAKPVPVNPLNWREKNKANFWVSAAGPLSNLILAVISFVILKSMIEAQDANLFTVEKGGAVEALKTLVGLGLTVNVSLAIFNLIPIPPLDGSGVLESLLPDDAQAAYEQLRPFGFILLYGLVLLGVFTAIINPVMRALGYLLRL